MPITDAFSVAQAQANSALESLRVSDEVRQLIQRGLNGELTTTDIINTILEANRA